MNTTTLKLPILAIEALSFILLNCENTDTQNVNAQAEATAIDLDAAKHVILEKTKQFTEAHITRDTVFLDACFTSDARVFPPNSEAVAGLEAISKLNADWVNYGVYAFTETSTAFYGGGDYLIDEGTYYLKYGPDSTVDEGKYINIWTMEEGAWKICSNIWNTSLPAAE